MADGISVVPAAQPRATADRSPASQDAAGTAGPARLSFGQEWPWFTHHLFPKSDSYHVPIAFRLYGDLDVTALENAFTDPVKRHTVLCTTYRPDGVASIVPNVGPADPFIIQVINVPTGTAEECRELVLAGEIDTLLAAGGTEPE
jgi:hypothetical protein